MLISSEYSMKIGQDFFDLNHKRGNEKGYICIISRVKLTNTDFLRVSVFARGKFNV